MPFHLHDTLRGQKIPLPSRTPGEASIYLCGPTVYNLIHVGNARPAVVFDTLVRHLRAGGMRVKYVRNYTDIDDRIIATAVEQNEAPMAVAERYITEYARDVSALNCVTPDAEPRVSQHIPEIVAMTAALVERGFAYELKGSVYFEVAKFPGYGKLSKRELRSLHAGERVTVDEEKRSPLDFALWKAAKPGEPAGARWASPWGEGRPGWHIECSAMARKLLGDDFDLHAGGLDLVFPHHENEIAQSECANAAPFAHAWMHNGFVEVDVERNANFTAEIAEKVAQLRAAEPDLMKVSKSDPLKLAEFRAQWTAGGSVELAARIAVYERKVAYGYWFQLRRLLGRVEPEAIRLWLLGTHYRAPLSFEVQATGHASADGVTPDARFPGIEEAQKRIEYFYETKNRLLDKIGRASMTPSAPATVGAAAKIRVAFDTAMDDDLNTSGALAAANEAFHRANVLCDGGAANTAEARAVLELIDHITGVLGVAQGDPTPFIERVKARRVAARGLDAAEIDRLVDERGEARRAKDFARADTIRKELLTRGVEVRDNPAGGSSWRVADPTGRTD